MYVKKSYYSVPKQSVKFNGTDENHRMSVDLAVVLRAREVESIKHYDKELNLNFCGVGETKEESRENLLSFLSGAKKDIEKGIEEAKTI